MTIWNQIKNGFNKAVYGELTKEDYWEYYKRENPLPKVDAIELLNDLNELLEYRRQATVNAMETDIIESDDVIDIVYLLVDDFVHGSELL